MPPWYKNLQGAKKSFNKQRRSIEGRVRKRLRRLGLAKGGNSVGTSSTLGTLSKLSHDPFPPRFNVKMYYNDVIDMTGPSTNLASEYIYCLNSLFDPDTSGTGHQPYCYDTMALLYTAYMVNKAVVELEFFDPSNDGIIVGYQVQGNAVSGATRSAVQERPWVESADISNTGNQKHCFRITLPCHEVLGLRRSQYRDDTTGFGAAVSASPVGLCYLRLFAISTIASTSTAIKCNVKITYHSTFWNRVTQSQSS